MHDEHDRDVKEIGGYDNRFDGMHGIFMARGPGNVSNQLLLIRLSSDFSISLIVHFLQFLSKYITDYEIILQN